MLFKRIVKLTIEINGTQKVYEHRAEDANLKIEFQITKSLDKEEVGQFSITGLPLNDIQNLSTQFDYDKDGNATAKKNLLVLEAGYEDDFGMIFCGAVMEAKPNISSADFGVDLKAQGGYYAITQREPISLKECKLSDIAKTIADAFGTSLNFTAEDKDVGDYSWSGSTQAQFKQFVKNYGVKAWIDNNVLCVADKNKANTKTQAIKIDCESGLIGQPEPTGKGLNFTTLLRPSLKINSQILMEFTKYPMLNGQYNIMSIQHKGSNYGDEFFSVCQGLKL